MPPPRTAFYAPAHRVMNKQNAGQALPPDVAMSLDFAGNGLQDHRLPYDLYNGTNASTAVGVLGWNGVGDIRTLSVVPATKDTANIAALANVQAGVAMTLAGASTGITVLAAALPVFPGVPLGIPVGALILDGNPAIYRYGQGFITAVYSPASMLGRAVSVTGVASGTGGDVLISGYDIYGYAQSELITVGAGANTVNGKKAFKAIVSAVPQFTDAHTYSVGTTDIFGFPLFASSFYDQEIQWNNAAITATTGFTAGDDTAPTTTTGDVRGTYAVQSASDGTKRLVVNQRMSLSECSSKGFSIGLFGQTPV